MKQTKLAIAKAIIEASTKDNVAKKDILEKIVNEIGVSRSNAFVYYTKATKGVSKPTVKEAVEVVQKASAKKEKKLSDIDRFIASVKAQAENKPIPSPFAGLGV